MSGTDTTERGLERLTCTALTGHSCDPVPRPAADLAHDVDQGADYLDPEGLCA